MLSDEFLCIVNKLTMESVMSVVKMQEGFSMPMCATILFLGRKSRMGSSAASLVSLRVDITYRNKMRITLMDVDK
jgi:hypothetical protein